jgi:hypothetical protein
VNSSDNPVNRVGINFGAPGDRRDPNGLLWLEHPAVAGESPPLAINVSADGNYFHRHGSTMDGHELPWVLASGVEGVSEVTIGLKQAKGSQLVAGISIDHASDDAEENEKGTVDLKSSDLELVEEAGTQLVGMRFNKLNLPRNATIRSAFIQFTCDEAEKKKTSLIIAAEKSANAERFSSDSHDLSSRTRTAAEAAWQPAAWPVVGAAGDAQRTPDLAAMIREVIALPDWKSGNSLAFLISGSGKRVAEAYGNDAKLAPRLMIETDEAVTEPTRGPASPHHVRLFFGSPPQAGLERCVFDVYVQGKLALSDVALDPAGDATVKSAVHSIENVMIEDQLQIRFVAKEGRAVISGVELRATDESR